MTQFRPVSDPDVAPIFTSDIERFWQAVDQSTPETLADSLQERYLSRGTEGLREFTTRGIHSASRLAEKVKAQRERYERVRRSTLSIESAHRVVRAPLYAFKYLYPDAVFPRIYFVISCSGSSTFHDCGPVIAAEEVRNSWDLAHLVAHEFIHFEQNHFGFGRTETLLSWCLFEGGAEFITELITGSAFFDSLACDEHMGHSKEAVLAHEHELWSVFQKEMFNRFDPDRDRSEWLYSTPPDGRPPDLGYFMGYRIVESYYRRAADKRQAVHDILTMTDFQTFLSASAYNP